MLIKDAIRLMDNSTNMGVLYLQIWYWYKPTKSGESKLSIKIRNNLWIAKSADEWAAETGMLPRTVRTTLDKLEERGVIHRKLKKFKGQPTIHLRMNPTILMLTRAIESKCILLPKIGKVSLTPLTKIVFPFDEICKPPLQLSSFPITKIVKPYIIVTIDYYNRLQQKNTTVSFEELDFPKIRQMTKKLDKEDRKTSTPSGGDYIKNGINKTGHITSHNIQHINNNPNALEGRMGSTADIVANFKKRKKSSEAPIYKVGHFETYWQESMSEFHEGEITVKFSGKQVGYAKSIMGKVDGNRIPNLIDSILKEWDSFKLVLYNDYKTKIPQTPCIAALAANIEHAVNHIKPEMKSISKEKKGFTSKKANL